MISLRWVADKVTGKNNLINKYDTTTNGAVKCGDYTGVPQGRLLWPSQIVVDNYRPFINVGLPL